MTINVYWCRANPGRAELQAVGGDARAIVSPMRYLEPVPLLKHIDYKEFFGPFVSKCPAIVDDLKNIFVIKSPIDISITVNSKGVIVSVEGQKREFSKIFLGDHQGKVGIHQLSMAYLFFAEKSLIATQLPAYYDTNSFVENTIMISASFDIGRWFRPAGKPALMFKPGERTISIKEGDPLMYVKFNTDEKVRLIEFDNTEFEQQEEHSPVQSCVRLKEHSSTFMSLERCYEYFERFKMRNRILKVIKRNKIK